MGRLGAAFCRIVGGLWRELEIEKDTVGNVNFVGTVVIKGFKLIFSILFFQQGRRM